MKIEQEVKRKKLITIDESRLNDLVYWEYLIQLKENEVKLDKKETLCTLIGSCYSKSPIEIRHNRQLVMSALTNHSLRIWSVDSEIKDVDFCAEYVERYPYPCVGYFPEKLQELFLDDCIKKDAYAIRDVFWKKNLYHLNTKENIIKWIKLNPDVYKELQKQQRYSKDISIAEYAFQNKPDLLFVMNRTVARTVVAKNLNLAKELFKVQDDVFPLLPKRLRSNHEFVKENIKKIKNENLKYIAKELFLTEDILLTLNYFHFELSPLNEDLLGKRHVVKHLLTINRDLYKRLKDTQDFTVAELFSEIIREGGNYYIYNCLSESLKKNNDILYALTTIGTYYDTSKKSSNFFTGAVKSPIVEMFHEDTINFLKGSYLYYLGINGSLTQDIRDKMAFNLMNNELNSYAKKYYLEIFLEKKLGKSEKNKLLKI